MARAKQEEKKSERINPALISLAMDVKKLKLDPHNARKHGERSLEVISRSLSEFGQQKPIVVLKDGTVVAGNGTLEAAKKLGWKRIACVVFEDEEKARSFAVADNRAGELSSWDADILLQCIEELGSEIGSMGFTDGEVQDFVDLQRNPFVAERVDLSELKVHPRNYRKHPEEQLEHIMRSIEAHGFYRNVVVARDNTILAGHGVVEAARKLGRTRVPVIRLDVKPDEGRALKVIASDNEIQRLAERDDEMLLGLLRDIMGGKSSGLVGTGFDADAFEELKGFVDGRISRVGDVDPYEEWKGMPEFHNENVGFRKLIVHFDNQVDVDAFSKLVGCELTETTRSIWYPEKEDKVMADKRYVSEP